MDPPLAPPHGLRILHRPNGGAGAARNTGLEAAGEAHRYIALLDSDDTWHPGHAETLVAALEQGFDVFFSDHDWPGDYASAFAQRSFCDGAAVPGQEGLFALSSAEALSAFLRCCPGQTSTIGWRRDIAPGLRFRTDLDPAEDLLFFCQLMSRAERICYTTEIDVSRGWGVSIYAGTMGWDTRGAVKRVCNSLRMRRQLLAESFGGDAAPLARIAADAAGLERDLCWMALRALAKRRPAEARAALPALRDDPALLARLPLHLARMAVAKLRGTYRAQVA
jgi:succinoglycan biosynthesis protein ExoW